MIEEAIKVNTVTLISGDSLKVLGKLPSNSINCIVTSPPYWGLRDYGIDGQLGLEQTIDSYFSSLLRIFNELHRILKPDGTLWFNIGDGYTSGNRKYRAFDKKVNARTMTFRPDNPTGLKNKDLLGLPWRLAFMLQKDGWFLRSDIIWHKPNAMPESVKDRPSRNHEYLFLFSKSEKYYFNNEELYQENLDKKLRSVWTINQKGFNGNHFAVFPLDLVVPCIKSSTSFGDIILDPFCGTGTVGEACISHNRRFVGIDINPEFIEISKKRMSLDTLDCQKSVIQFN